MEAIFPMVFMIGVFGLIVWWGMSQAKKRNAMYAQAAAQLGLEIFSQSSYGHPKLSGIYRGFMVNVDIEVHGSGKHKTTYTRFRVAFPDRVPSGLNVTKEGLGGKIGKFFGGQDIQVGDPTLDNALLIKGDDPAQVVAFFNKRTPKGRVGDGILSFIGQGAQSRLNEREGAVTLVLGYMKNTAQLQNHLDNVVDHMAWISGQAADSGPVVQPWEAPAPEKKPAPAKDIFFDPDAPAKPAELPPPSELPPVIPPAPEKKPEKVRWDITDLQKDSAPAPQPASQPAASQPPPAPKAAPQPSGTDPRLEKLAERSLGYRQRSELLEQLETETLQVQVVVEGSERTRGVGLSDDLREGMTLLGKVGACAVAVRFPESRNAELQSLSPGSSMSLRVRVVDWDNFYRRATMELA
ncbi:MAG: hypothetical protein VX899_07410 [Myxococcota bacterium]|nr:hypothetical protein [Myxococcota bacterium]